ncbi:MAG: hypothetical protein K0Q72_4866, partial [Armatimonadetes bacterium]|nr:hypothetical protein [Armatimonadota bacterium]
WGLGSMYKAVFNPKQAHYYEFKGCRIEPNDVVIDAGACEGFFTRFALLRGARVIVVEPWSKMAEALTRTYAKEIAEGRVQVVRALISDRVGMSALTFDPNWPYGANQVNTNAECSHSEAVAETTIDKIIEECGWGTCDFIKMDIEGAEPKAMIGAEKTLRKYRPDIAIAVYHTKADYALVTGALKKFDLGYKTITKGMIKLVHEPVWRPRMLHGWHLERPAAG